MTALLAASLAIIALLLIRLRDLRRAAQAQTGELREEREARARERAARAVLEEQLESERRAAADRQALLAESFEGLSRRALQANNEQFLQLARESLGALTQAAKGDMEKRQQAIGEMVRPLSDSVQKLDDKLQRLDNARAVLSQQVGSLLSETGNLVKALRAPAVRGRWGEIQLKRVVELAGMLEHCDFAEQQTLQRDEGRLRPDLIVKLPDGKHLVVDAKVPLTAYLDALEARDDPSRRAHLATHARQLRNHVAQLSRKAYWDQLEVTPDYVVLFVPNEAVFAAAMEQDPALMESACQDKVLLASPTTLIALLRAAAFGWRQERLAADAQEIASLGKDLHKRLSTMVSHFARVGKGLSSAVGAYNDTVGSFEHMVVPGARKLREKAAPMDEELVPLPEVDAQPRPLQPADPAVLPEEAN